MQQVLFFSVFSLVVMMIFPAYAEVESISLEKPFYTDEEEFVFVGVESTGKQSVFVVLRGPGGNYIDMVSDPASDNDGVFSTIPRVVEKFFTSSGIYNATAFGSDQKEKDGISIILQYDGNKVFEKEDFVLSLKPIPDRTVTEGEQVSFTVTVSDSSLDDLVFSLEKNPPAGASIDRDNGKFTWTPSVSQGNANGLQYFFDIVVEKGAQRDSESVILTVKDPVVSQPDQPKDEPKDEPKDTSENLGIASFVDQSKDPKSYVDRYNNEPSYKAWFDDNFPEYDSIYQAVGLDEETEPEIMEPSKGNCGEGTELVDGICTAIDQPRGGGCLIATAAYGSEMAPQVQFLREIRDNKVMSTESGVSFMTGFNQFYYSFSPVIADYERENPLFKEAVKIGLTPMLSSLSILSVVDVDSEQEMLGYGIAIILANIGMYFVAPAMVVYGIKKAKLVRF